MYQMDPRHTGRSSQNGPSRPVVARTFNTAAVPTDTPFTPRADIQSSFAVAPDGTVYIANFQGNLFALRDPGQGDSLEMLWRFHPANSSSLHSTPAVGRDGTVYLGFSARGTTPDQQATLYALRGPASNGEPQIAWKVDIGNGGQTSSPMLGSDDIYIVNGQGKLFVVMPDGTVKWTAQAGPVLKGSPAMGYGPTVYIPSTDGKLYAVDPPASGGREGSVRWTFDFGEHLGPTPLVTTQPAPGAPGGGGGASGIGSGASPTVAQDGTIFIGANNSNMYAIRPDGSLKWLFEAERELAGIWTTPCLDIDERFLYFGANKGGVYALNTSDGSLAWRFNIYGSIYASLALDNRKTLFVGSTVGHLFALDSRNGEPIFDYDVGQQVWSAPAILPNGSLVIGDRTGRIILFGPN